ncbi:MAG: toll/interleukin-1 receptor domain-containing protein [Chloroflexota bacterium]
MTYFITQEPHMGRIEKTVFISYRRTNLPWALFIYQNLTMHGYDVFFDYLSIDIGQILLLRITTVDRLIG